MSLEILRKALVLNAVSDHEIPALVRTFNIDRVLVTQSRSLKDPADPDILAKLLSISPVPVGVIGRAMDLNEGAPPTMRRILLPVTQSLEDKFSFRFACELARSEGASLSVLHVFGRLALGHTNGEKSPVTVKSWLPIDGLAETSMPTPLEVTVREGDPMMEILEFNSRKPHDLVVLRRSPVPRQAWNAKPDIVSGLYSQLACPVLVLGNSIEGPGYRAESIASTAGRSPTGLNTAHVGWQGNVLR